MFNGIIFSEPLYMLHAGSCLYFSETWCDMVLALSHLGHIITLKGRVAVGLTVINLLVDSTFIFVLILFKKCYSQKSFGARMGTPLII